MYNCLTNESSSLQYPPLDVSPANQTQTHWGQPLTSAPLPLARYLMTSGIQTVSSQNLKKKKKRGLEFFSDCCDFTASNEKRKKLIYILFCTKMLQFVEIQFVNFMQVCFQKNHNLHFQNRSNHTLVMILFLYSFKKHRIISFN